MARKLEKKSFEPEIAPEDVYQENLLSPKAKWVFVSLATMLLVGGIIIRNLRKESENYNESNESGLTAESSTEENSGSASANNTGENNSNSNRNVDENSTETVTTVPANSSNNASTGTTTVETRTITEKIYIKDAEGLSFNYDSGSVKVKDGKLQCIKDDRILQWHKGRKEWECEKAVSVVFGDLDENSVNINGSGELECENDGDVLYWDGNDDQWACGDRGSVEILAGDGISSSDNTVSVNAPTCSGTDKLQWNGSAFVCSSDVDTDTNTDAQTLTFNSGTEQLSISGGNSVDLSAFSTFSGSYNNLTNVPSEFTPASHDQAGTTINLDTTNFDNNLSAADDTTQKALETLDELVGVGGAITSVFGRTGVVTAQTNDYTWAQIDKTTSDIADITTKSHTSLTDIGTNTHAQIDSHISNTSNPHSVTAAQVGNTTAQWNADSIQGITVDDTDIANGKILQYNSVSGNLEYETPSSGVTDHTLLSNIGTNTHAQIDTHIADSTLHFTEGSIDHANITNLNSASYYHLTQTNHTDLTDSGDTALHYHSADRDRANHTGTQTASTISDFDEAGQDAVGGILSTEFTYDDVTPAISLNYSNISHTSLQDIGTNTHAQIDTHIADTSNPHSVTATQVSADTTTFDNNLSVADNTVQKALETLDEISGGGGSTTFTGLTDTMGSLTAGSVLFTTALVVSEDNSNFFWDTVTSSLGIGTNSVSAKAHIKGSTTDNTAYGLKVDDSASAKNLYVRNDGQVEFKNYLFPTADGTNGQVLKTNGTGTLSWQNDSDTGGSPNYSDVNLDASRQIGTPTTVTTLDKAYDYMWSAGLYSGFGLTDNGDGTINVADGEGVLRTSASPTAPLHLVKVSGVNNLALIDSSPNYIYVDYNAGSPTISLGTSTTDFNCLDKCILYKASRVGTEIKYINMMSNNVDSNRSVRRKDFEMNQIDIGSGAKVSEIGSRYLNITAGSFWNVLSNVTTPAFDTSGTDSYELYYRNGVGGWTKTDGNTQIDNLYYDDGSGTLATLANNKFGTRFIFMGVSETGAHPVVVMGQAEHATQEEAENEPVPGDLPPEVDAVGAILALTTVQKSATNLSSILNATEESFSASLPTTHNNLSGLQGGTTNEYYHLDLSDFTDLTTFLGFTALPDTDGTNGQVLKTDGAGTLSWADDSTGGTAPTFKGATINTQGLGNGTFYGYGFYDAPATDANLNQGASTQTVGTANAPYGAHAFIVASGAGTASGGTGAVEIEVSGTSMTDAGVRTAGDSEVIVADITSMSANAFYETSKKWIGQVTFTLQNASGSTQTTYAADFNYGLAKYEDFGNRDFTITDFEVVGLGGAIDTSWSIELLKHSSTGWTYSSTAFEPGGTSICDSDTDYNTENNIAAGESFAYKRAGLNVPITGTGMEGIIVKMKTTQNNVIEFANLQIGATF